MLLLASPALAGPATFHADFRKDPARAGFAVEGADDGRFAWVRGRDLRVRLDSNDPAARLAAPLGVTLDETTSFRVAADLVLMGIDASPDDFFQISFGLTRAGVTGLNRTGTSLPAPPFFVDDADTFDSIELDYYPNVTFFGGPFLQPTAFGPARGSAFSNFAANFGPSADLGDNGPGEIRELPQGVPLRIVMEHDACARALATRVIDVSSGDELATGLLPLDLSFLDGGFTVDTFAIHAYQDLADFDPSTTSLRADVAFLGASVEAVAERSALVLPRALNAEANGPAHVRVRGGLAEPGSVTLVESGGSPVSVPLVVRGSLAAIPRALAVSPMTVDVDGCAVPVIAPEAVPR